MRILKSKLTLLCLGLFVTNCLIGCDPTETTTVSLSVKDAKSGGFRQSTITYIRDRQTGRCWFVYETDTLTVKEVTELAAQ